jgi:hypothetical protein
MLFHEFERQWTKERKCETKEPVDIPTGWGTFIRLIIRNPIVLAYFIPIIGWFILVRHGNKKWTKLDDLGRPF